MLRILFSRLGQPHIGSPNAFSFNVPSVRASGAITIEHGAGRHGVELTDVASSRRHSIIGHRTFDEEQVLLNTKPHVRGFCRAL
jgi:hypothetical protein